jgi:hypothetical protein
VIKNFLGCDVCKAYHVVIQNVQVHWIKNSNDLFLKRLFRRVECTLGEDCFLPRVSDCAELCRRSLVQNCRCTSWGCWVGPKDCSIFACWCNNCVCCVGENEAKVSQKIHPQNVCQLHERWPVVTSGWRG